MGRNYLYIPKSQWCKVIHVNKRVCTRSWNSNERSTFVTQVIAIISVMRHTVLVLLWLICQLLEVGYDGFFIDMYECFSVREVTPRVMCKTIYRVNTTKHNKTHTVCIFLELYSMEGSSVPWASYQIRKIACCACAGNAGNVSPRRRFQRKPLVGDPGMHHGTCVTHVPWCMSGSLTCGDGENVPGIPGACAPATLRIWQEAHGGDNVSSMIHCCALHNSSVDLLLADNLWPISTKMSA